MGVALLLAVLGLGCVAARGHLPARTGTYGGLVLMVVAGLVATPGFTALAGRLLRRLLPNFLGISGRLAVDNVLRAPGRTGLVVAALAAGVALLVQTGGLLSSNEEGVRSWVDQSIAGDLFATSGGPLSASGRTLPMGWSVVLRLQEEFPDVRVVPMRFRHLDWRQDGHSARLLVVALDAAAYVAANEHRDPRLPDLGLYQKLSEPGTVLVSDNFAALHGLGPGDLLTLPGTDGPVSLRILGTVADYSCHQGTVLVDRQQLRRHFDADLIDVLDIYLPAGTEAGAVRRQMQQAPWATEHSLCLLTRGEVRSHILGMIGRLYGLAYAQEVVVAVVAVLGVVTALLISVLQRRRELGLLRAVGATRRQVLQSVLAEALLLAGLGTVLGLVMGLPLEWYAVRVVLFEESGFLCPLLVPWTAMLVVIILSLACAVLAGLGPAWQAAATPIVEAVDRE
jgi:putative ABC transport system permease protein